MSTAHFYKPGAPQRPIGLLPIHIPRTLLPEVFESNRESAWAKFDEAVIQLDFANQSERLAWTK